MFTTHFECPGRRCRKLVSWDDANAAGIGTFCSQECRDSYRSWADCDQGRWRDLQLYAEDCNYWRAYARQVGDSDAPNAAVQANAHEPGMLMEQLDDLKPLPSFG